MNRTDQEQKKMMEINERMVDRTVRVTEGQASGWIGKVVSVIDHENFFIRRNKDSEAQTVNMFDIRSL
jgi:hypothetical protein